MFVMRPPFIQTGWVVSTAITVRITARRLRGTPNSAPKAPWPIELKFQKEHEFDEPDWEDFDIPDEFEAMGYRAPRKRPWPSRDNFFTKMLYKIGKGVAVGLTYVHNGEKFQKQFVIEQSPRDALSSKKYKE